MSTHATAPERVIRILTIVAMLLMLAVPAMAAPAPAPAAAPTGTGDVTTVTVISPTTAAPAYFPAGQQAVVEIKFSSNGSSADGPGEVFWQVGSLPSMTANTTLPVASGTLTFTVPVSDASGAKDVRVCARGPGQGGQICATLQSSAVQFVTAAPGGRWPFAGAYADPLIAPNKPNAAGSYDVFLSIPANGLFDVVWDTAKVAAAVPNQGATPVTLELWDATNYQATPTGGQNATCYTAAQLADNGIQDLIGQGGNGMILRWKSAPLANISPYPWRVPPTLGSCFLMRLVVSDQAGQSGWDWSGPTQSLPKTNPDPLTGRFQITAYDTSAPVLSLDGQKVQCMQPISPTLLGAPAGASGPYLGPFSVNASDPQSGIDWVWFTAKWAGGSGPAFPVFPQPALALWKWFLYTNPAAPVNNLYAGYIPTSTVPALTAGLPFTIEVTARNMTGLTSTLSITNMVYALPVTLTFAFDENCSAKHTEGFGEPCVSYLAGTKEISGTVQQSFKGEVAGVDFYWQPTDVNGVLIGPEILIGAGTKTSGAALLSNWKISWNTAEQVGGQPKFPDGYGKIIAKVKNCAGYVSVTEQGVNYTRECKLAILNSGPSCELGAVVAPFSQQVWQIGQGYQYPLAYGSGTFTLGGNTNGMILWNPLKLHGVFPPETFAGLIAYPPGFPAYFPTFSSGPISNIQVSWDNGAHWIDILPNMTSGDPSKWTNQVMYQTNVPGSTDTSFAGFPWAYVHGNPNRPNSWLVRLQLTDVAGNKAWCQSPNFSVFGREQQVGTDCGPTPPTSSPYAATVLNTCENDLPLLIAPTGTVSGTVKLQSKVWDPETGISSVQFCYKKGTGGWECPSSLKTTIPDGSPVPVLGPYTYTVSLDTTTLTDGSYTFKETDCNGVGMCVDSETSEVVKIDNTAPTFPNIWPRSWQTIENVYCAEFQEPVDDATALGDYEFQYKMSTNSGVTWSNWLQAGNVVSPTSNTGCGAFQGRLPFDVFETPENEAFADGTLLQVRGRISDTLGNVSDWITHYQITIDNQFPDRVRSVDLTKGWNLISLPYPPAQPDIEPVLPSQAPSGTDPTLHGVLKDLFDMQAMAPITNPFTFHVHAYGNPLGSYNVPDNWSVYDPVGLKTLTYMKAGAGFWVWVSEDVELYNFGVYPPRPYGTQPDVYQAGKYWNLMGYTDAIGAPPKVVGEYFGADIVVANPPGPTAIYQYCTGQPWCSGPGWSIPSLTEDVHHFQGYWVAYLNGRAITP